MSGMSQDSKVLISQETLLDRLFDDNFVINAKLEKECFDGNTYPRDIPLAFSLCSGKVFIKTTFDNCTFKNLTVANCVFKNCYFYNCTFQNIDLTLDTYISSCSFLNECHYDTIRVFDLVTIGRSFFDKNNTINNINFVNERQVSKFAIKNGYAKSSEKNTFHDFALRNFTYTPKYKHYPSDCDFVGWKVIKDAQTQPLYLVKLLIPKDAKVSSWIGDKVRADRAYVLNIYNQDGKEVQEVTAKCAINDDIITTYTVGKYVYPDSFDDDHRNVCSNGIHFFLDKQEAIDYNHFAWTK